MATHVLYLPQYLPVALNKLLEGHRSQRGRLKQKQAELVRFYALSQELPAAKTKRRVDLRVVLPKGQRAWDPDAMWKGLLDALVSASLLVDDNPKWCQLGEVVYLRSGTDLRETYVILTDLD